MSLSADIAGIAGGTPHQRRRRRRVAAVTAKRSALMGTGGVLLVVGIAMVPTPIPVGLVLFAMGLYFLARGSKVARRSIKHFRRRSPRFSRGLNSLKHRLPTHLRAFIERSDPGV